MADSQTSANARKTKVRNQEKKKLEQAYAEVDERNKATVALWIEDAAELKARMSEMRDTSREYSAVNGQYIQIRKQLDRMLSGSSSSKKDDELLEFFNG